MKKVVFLVPSLGMGGMERVLVNYANLFVKRGYDVTVLNFTFDDTAIVDHFDDRVRYVKNYMPVKNLWNSSVKDILSLNFRVLPWQKWVIFHSSEYLYKKYIREKFDVEIAFFGSESIKIISGSNNPNSFGWIHNVNIDDDIMPLGNHKKAKQVYGSINNLICVSQQSKERIKEVFGRSERVYAINNPNDTKRIRQLSDEKIDAVKNGFTFSVVARFDDHQKGFLRLFDVCKRLKDDSLRFTLWLVGDGIDYDMIKNKAYELALDNVVFFGKRSNPYPYIKNSEMYLSASYFEGFSMVMMEAVILGKPMLTTDVSGADEMLEGGKYGMIVENSEEGLYNGMKRILTEPELYRHYCEMAGLRKDYLSEDRIMDQVEAIIKEQV